MFRVTKNRKLWGAMIADVLEEHGKSKKGAYFNRVEDRYPDLGREIRMKLTYS